MDRRLEHFLLPVGVTQQHCCDLASLGIAFKRSAICFKLEQFLRRDVYLQPLTEIHQIGAVAPCCP